MTKRPSDPPGAPPPSSSWIAGALDQRTDLVPPAWPEGSASHSRVLQMPAVSEDLARALRARGSRRPIAASGEGVRRGRVPTPDWVDLVAAGAPGAVGAEAPHGGRAEPLGPIAVNLGPGPAPQPAGPTRPSEGAWAQPRFAGAAATPQPVEGFAPPPQPPHASAPSLPAASLAVAPAPAPYAPPMYAPPLPGAPASQLEHPVVLGLLLLALPPVGLAILWASRAYGRDAKWAMTAFSALSLLLGSFVAALLLVR